MIYQISDKLLFDLVEFEKTVININKSELSTKSLLELRQSSIIDELYYFAKKMNIKMTFGEAKQIAVGKEIDTSDNPSLKLVYNYRSLLDFMRQNDQEPSMNLMVHINKLLGNGILDIWECGTLRNTSLEIKRNYDFLTTNLKNNVEPFVPERTIKIVNAVKVLKYITSNKPFVGLNDATGIALFSLEIIRLFENDLIFSPIKLLDEVDLPNELIRDVEHLQEIVVMIANAKVHEILQRIERENYDESIRNKSKFLNLNERQLAALRYLEHNLKISRRQYMKLFSVSTMTAFRDMNQLVEQKIASVEGKGRGTYYRLER